FQGYGTVAANPIPPTMWSYNDAIENAPRDVEKAKELLAEAGVTDLHMEIWAMPVSRPYNPNARRMAELIQADFAEIGVDAEIVSYEWGEYQIGRARLNSSHVKISYAVFCLKKKKKKHSSTQHIPPSNERLS